MLPPSLASLGLWIEQLIAESTGKHGKGALPVVDEPLGRPDEYGTDRAFVAIAPTATHVDGRASRRSRRPVIRCCTSARGSMARRGVLPLGIRHRRRRRRARINPFDEPNVSEAKEKTKALLETFASTAHLRRRPHPAASSGG